MSAIKFRFIENGKTGKWQRLNYGPYGKKLNWRCLVSGSGARVTGRIKMAETSESGIDISISSVS